MSSGGAWSARLARFQLAGAAIWWISGIVFSTKAVLLTILDSMYSRTKPLPLPLEKCLRTIIACNCSVVGTFPYKRLYYAMPASLIHVNVHPCHAFSISQSVCPLFRSSFSNVQMLCFCIIQRTIKQSMHDASFCFAMRAPCSNATPSPAIPSHPYPFLTFRLPHINIFPRTTTTLLPYCSLRPRSSWSRDYSWLLPFSQRGIGVLLWGGLDWLAFALSFSLFSLVLSFNFFFL